MSARTRILVVAAYSSIRAGLQALLASEPDFHVLGDTPAGADALVRLLADLDPNVLIIDTSGDGPGVDSLGRVLTAIVVDSHYSPAIVLIGDSPDRDIPRLTAAALSGWGYLLRDAAAAQISGAVRAAASGLVVVSPDLPIHSGSDTTARNLSMLPDEYLPGESLTPRESEVLALMAEGLPNKIIAVRLGISLHTAKFHVAQILGKLGSASRTEAVTVGARRGYLTL